MTTFKAPETLEEAKEMIADMFSSEDLGTFGNRHWNGADSYKCPSCYASKQIMGYCDTTSYHDAVDHEPDCRQDALYKWANDIT